MFFFFIKLHIEALKVFVGKISPLSTCRKEKISISECENAFFSRFLLSQWQERLATATRQENERKEKQAVHVSAHKLCCKHLVHMRHSNN